MQVHDVMTRDVVTVQTDTPLAQAIDDMIRAGIGGLPVVDASQRVVGIVTDSDIIARRGFDGLPPSGSPLFDEIVRSHRNRWRQRVGGIVVGEVMTTPASTVRVDTALRVAAARLVTMSLRRLPVVDDDGRLVGIISQRDVLRVLHRDDATIASELGALLGDSQRCPAGRRVDASADSGIVTLSGSVPSSADALQIVAAVRDLPGVLAVHDDIVVEVGVDPGPAADRVADSTSSAGRGQPA